MKPRAIHQLVHTLSRNDAIGEHTLEIQRLLRHEGYESNIYSEFGIRGAEDLITPVDDLAAELRNVSVVGETVVLFHHSTGTPLIDRLLSWDAPIVVNYHNITPAKYFAPYDPRATSEMLHGRRQTELIRARAIGAICDSTFNATDYCDGVDETFDRSKVTVASILRNWSASPTGDQRTAGAAEGKGSKWLFVGRISPNKAQHDVVAALAVYRQQYDPQATLTLVGYGSPQGYADGLAAMITSLGLTTAVDIRSGISERELGNLYASADVFVCLSEHEGFCVPLVEALRDGVPVVAFESSAVTETVGNAGILLTRKDPCTVAAAAHLMATDLELRAVLASRAMIRAEYFSLENSRRRFVGALDHILERTAASS